MNYPFNDDHQMIREAVTGFARDWYDSASGLVKFTESRQPFDKQAWQEFAGNLGFSGIAIAEQYGGAALGNLGRVVTCEALGQYLVPIPFLTTGGVVTDIVSAFGTQESKSHYLPKIACGEISAAYCDGHDAAEKKVTHVVNASGADVIVLSRRASEALEIIAMSADAPGLIIAAEPCMDATRSFASIDWSGVSESNISVIGYTRAADLRSVVLRSLVGLAAECVGGAQTCLDLTLEYTGQRVQFGRTIASFQAVKHRVADMFIALEAARSAVYAAAVAEPEEADDAALIAKAVASEAFYTIAGDAIQLHGGIGFTWEYPLHYFFKRARANKAMFGTPARDYEYLAAKILDDEQ